MKKSSTFSAISLAVGLGIATVLSSASSASAFTYTFGQGSQSSNSTATGASATVDFDFIDLGNNQFQLDLLITNTTGDETFGSGASTSKLTGIGFDMFDGISLESSSLGDNLDTLITDASLNPFGTFDFGIADNNNFTGGNANQALAEGLSNNISMIYSGLNGEDLESFRARFETALSDPDGELKAVARFQQVNAGAGSDKLFGGTIAGGTIGGTPPEGEPEPEVVLIPEPSSLLGLGLLAGGMIKLAKRKREEDEAITVSLLPTA